MSILDKLLDRAGLTRDQLARKRGELGRVARRRGVSDSAELHRVLELPRRVLDDVEGEALARLMTRYLRRSGGSLQLRPAQAWALAELHDYGGLFAPLRVGSGKTLVSLLAGAILEARRPMLLVPARLRAKTEHDAAEAGRHFRFPPPRIVTYEWLGRMESVDAFLHLKPDLVIADEGHRLRNERAACTKRTMRYLRENPDVPFAVLSGTMMARSLEDFHHLLVRALPRLCPLPRTWGELQEWHLAIDEDVEPFARMAIGALGKLMSPEERAFPEVEGARRAVRRRIEDTAGVVATAAGGCAASLEIEELRVPEVVPDGTWREMRQTWETPSGWSFADASEAWRHARELALGFTYRWEVLPPREWLEARRAWAAFCRDAIWHRRGLDSEAQVAAACAAGRLDGAVYYAWTAVRDSYKPRTVADWYSTSALELCASWLDDEPGLCWVEQVEFGQKLAAVTGLPYHAGLARDAEGRTPEEAPGDRLILSIASCSEGRNLQRWRRNLVTSPPANGNRWEQLLGRTHRDGQSADEIEVDVLCGCIEHVDAIQRSIAEARYVEQVGGQPQKLLIAGIRFTTAEIARSLKGARWSAFTR